MNKSFLFTKKYSCLHFVYATSKISNYVYEKYILKILSKFNSKVILPLPLTICLLDNLNRIKMINQSLQFTNKLLGQFLKNRFGLDEEKIVLNYLVDVNGSFPKMNQNKVVLSLINVEKETNQPFYVKNRQLESGNYSSFNPVERYNLDILISSNFDDYTESLKFLDAIIYFFQINNYLDASTSSSIPEGLSKLEFEYEKISYHQMHSLWTAMGAKYQPSIIYKMKLVKVQANETIGIIPAVTNTNNAVTT